MHDNALTAPTRLADVDGRTLAYRIVGNGPPIVLCNRFRGVLDLWDPAFLDGLAARGFTVVTFDYAGLGHGGRADCGLHPWHALKESHT